MNRVVILLILLARCMGDASLANGPVSIESLLRQGLQTLNGSETGKPTPITPPTTDQTHSNSDGTVSSTSTSMTALAETALTDSENQTEISTSGGPTSSQPTISTEVTGKTVETPGATNSGIATTVSDGSGARDTGDSSIPDAGSREREGAHRSGPRGSEGSSGHSSVSPQPLPAEGGENRGGAEVPTVLPKTSGQASSDGDVRAGDGSLSAGGGGGDSDNVPGVGGGSVDNGGSSAVNNENKGIGNNDETGTKANTQTTDKGSNIQKSFKIWYTAVPSVVLFQEMRRP